MVTACVLEWLWHFEGFKLSIKTLRLFRQNSSSRKSGRYLEGACLFCCFNLVGFSHGMAWSCFELAAGQALWESLDVFILLCFPHKSHKSPCISLSLWENKSNILVLFPQEKKVNCLGSLGQNSRKTTKILSTYLTAGILGNKPVPKLCDSPQKPIIWKSRLWKLSTP